ncbi:MAG TPA: hypothetical protein VHB21_23900 [Minicystis sp.]|nr:hypothetical protein [Minicystis sp.]
MATADPIRPFAGEHSLTRPQRIAFWTFTIVGLLGAGVAFVYKVAEFIYTISGDEVKGFADVPVSVYFVVAAGWLCLLIWSFSTGKLKDLERAKYEMLEMEAEYERRGE